MTTQLSHPQEGSIGVRRPVTAMDVASAAGVSQATVSLSLRDHPRISPRTRELVRAVAAKMNYKPHAGARSLVDGKTHTIGVIFASQLKIGQTQLIKVYATAIECISEALIRQHFHLSLAAPSEITPEQSESLAPRLFEENAIDGAIVIHRPGPELADVLAAQSIPCVVIDEEAAPQRASVFVDEYRAAELAVQHLVGLGHKRIAWLGRAMTSWRGEQFMQGYVRTMAAAELPAIFASDKADGPDGNVDEYIHLLWSRSSPPTALIAYDDRDAVDCIGGLMRRGLSVPGDVSVMALHDVGYSEIVGCGGMVPTITCKANMQRPMAEAAVEMLLRIIDDPERNVPEPIVLEPRLFVRQSTGICKEE